MATRNLEFAVLARGATSCRECFTRREVSPAAIDVAQPRWIGNRYWEHTFRILILMCNPGEGLNYAESVTRDRVRLHEFQAGAVEALHEFLEDQKDSRWARFYVEGLKLDVDEVAFANVAWCATAGNRYPPSVLARCFARHTEPLLRLLVPHIVLAAGAKVQGFLRSAPSLPGAPEVLPVLHHAHRKGLKAQEAAFARVRRELKAARARRPQAG